MRVLLMAVVTMLAAFSAVSCIGAFAGERAEDSEVREITLSNPAALQLTLHNVNGHVDLFGEAGRSSVTLEIEKVARGKTVSEATSRLNEIQIVIDQNGNRVNIEAEYPQKLFERSSPNIYFTVRVPENVAGLDISTVNGHVDVRRVEVAQQLDVSSVNGAVEFEGNAPFMDISTVNGHVDVRGNGDAHISTQNGSIDGYLSGSSVDVHTTNGHINLDLEGANQGVIRTVNGGIDLDVLGTNDISIEATSGFGSIAMYGFESTSIDRRIHGSRGMATQGSPSDRLKLSTSNGSIRVDRIAASQ